MGERSTYTFTENTTTRRLWAGLKQSDTIMVLINLSEVDDWPDVDDHYRDQTFEVPVAEIVTSVLQGQDYFKEPLRVYDGDDYADFTIRFSYL